MLYNAHLHDILYKKIIYITYSALYSTNLNQNKMKGIIEFIKKAITHNHCDSCGFTKDEVFVAEFFAEAGLIQCEKCYNYKSE